MSSRGRVTLALMFPRIAHLILLVTCTGVSACEATKTEPSPIPAPSDERTPVGLCTDKGVAYFKEIGSYPTLSTAPNTGRRAEDVARERCERTTGAFDGLD